MLRAWMPRRSPRDLLPGNSGRLEGCQPVTAVWGKGVSAVLDYEYLRWWGRGGGRLLKNKTFCICRVSGASWWVLCHWRAMDMLFIIGSATSVRQGVLPGLPLSEASYFYIQAGHPFHCHSRGQILVTGWPVISGR